MQGIVVKNCVVVKNPDASWVETEIFSLYGLDLKLPCSVARQQQNSNNNQYIRECITCIEEVKLNPPESHLLD